jgi:GT2 family glycosyltransferase
MQVSVIIPTYNRVKDVDGCLDSVTVQTTLPKEVIIVDDSDNDEIENLIEQRKDEFNEKDMVLKYIRNEKEKSLTIARNIGIENATGDIILFLDDDVILDKDYIKEILKVYKDKPDAMGVQGLIPNKKNKTIINKFIEFLNKLFIMAIREKNKCRVLPSVSGSYPYFVNEIINCEYLFGANQSYKKEILEEFKFDEKLKKYSYGEDLDLSYRIFKKCPSSLFMTPQAKLIHKSSKSEHLKREVIYMGMIYFLYLFYKNIDQSLKNKLIHLWSRFGYFVLNLGTLILKPSKSRLLRLKYLIGAYIMCMNHIGEIKRGELDFFNKELRR